MITPDYDPRFLDTYIDYMGPEVMTKVLMRLLDMGYEYLNKETKEYLLDKESDIHVDHYGCINVLTEEVKAKKKARKAYAYDVLEAEILPYIPKHTLLNIKGNTVMFGGFKSKDDMLYILDAMTGTLLQAGTITLARLKESSSWKIFLAKAYKKYSKGVTGKIFAYDKLLAVKTRLKMDGYDISQIKDGSLCLRLGEDMKVWSYAFLSDFMASPEPLIDIDDISLPVLSKGSTVIVKDNVDEDFRIDFFDTMERLPDGTAGFRCRYTGTHRYCLLLQGNEDKLKKR